MENMLRLWHGSQGWDGIPELQTPKKGRAEHGCGIYCCAHYETARSYAAGGGVAMDVFIDPGLRLIEEIKISAEDLVSAARAIPRLRNRQAIIDDIHRSAERSKTPGMVGLNVIINLAVNHDAMIGQPAIEIAKFVASRGADASLYSRTNGDDWLVIFNPAVIIKTRRRPAATVDLAEYERDRVRSQLDTLRQLRSVTAPAAAATSTPSPRP